MIAFTKRVTSTLSNLGSATTSRRGMNPLRGMPRSSMVQLLVVFVLLPSPVRSAWDPSSTTGPRGSLRRSAARAAVALLRLGAVLRSALLPTGDAARVEGAAHDVIS